ncbi:MAG: ribosome maturation factor RimP [bacterium]|nr:ribosome maturation factor RimP [bacterium]
MSRKALEGEEISRGNNLGIPRNYMMYNDIPADLLRIVEPVVLDHGLELIDAGIRQAGGKTLVRIVLDTPEGDGKITADQCAGVSREVGQILEVEDLLPEAHTLEVSSPGVDKTLGREKDFERVVGRRIALETREQILGRRKFKGELVAFEAGQVHVRMPSEEIRIPFPLIQRAKAFYPSDPLKSKR